MPPSSSKAYTTTGMTDSPSARLPPISGGVIPENAPPAAPAPVAGESSELPATPPASGPPAEPAASPPTPAPAAAFPLVAPCGPRTPLAGGILAASPAWSIAASRAEYTPFVLCW